MTISRLEKYIDFISKFLTFAFKLGIFLGGGCIISYFLRIRHIPQDLSIGDGLLFLMAAVCFGLFYGLVIAIFTSLGILLLILLLTPFRCIFKKRCNPKAFMATAALLAENKIMILPIVVLAVLAVIIIFVSAVYQYNATYLWQMPVLSVLLGILFEFSVCYGNMAKENKMVKDDVLRGAENNSAVQPCKTENHRVGQLCIWVIISGSSG